MNNEAKCYSLLIGVGIYQDEERKTLTGTGKDLLLMQEALTEGLKFDPDNIRVLGEDGNVQARSFARALSEFEGLIGKEDTFVLYFTGHGVRSALYLFPAGAHGWAGHNEWHYAEPAKRAIADWLAIERNRK